MQLTEPTINLNLPRNWQQCSTRQLEIIAKAMIEEEQRALFSKSPNNNDNIKMSVLMRMGGLEVVSDDATPVVPVEDQYIVARHKEKERGLFHSARWTEPFVLYIWQIHHWMKNDLAWLDKSASVVNFPYPYIMRRVRKFAGPDALMQNFSWSQYRIAGEWLQFYFDTQKRYFDLSLKKDVSKEEIFKVIKQLDSAKAGFLATIYCKKVIYVDEESRRMKRNYKYLSNQSVDNAKFFRLFDDVKFRVILMWWSGMMQYYESLYPKCFGHKSKPTDTNKKRKRNPNPLETYTRLMATMEKYCNDTEDNLNRKKFTIILQHLDDMIRENEEFERISKKK